MSWVLVRPDASVADAVGLPRVELPVRADRVDEIFGRRVDLCGLIDGIEEFAAEDPSAIPQLAASVICLATAAVDDLLWSRNFGLAARYAQRGLRWEPNSIALQVRLGRALFGVGEQGPATAHWVRAVVTAREAGHWSPMLWLLTARALIAEGRDGPALTLLDDLADMLPDWYDFWELRATVVDRLATL